MVLCMFWLYLGHLGPDTAVRGLRSSRELYLEFNRSTDWLLLYTRARTISLCSKDYYGEVVLHIACVNGDLRLFKDLIQNGADAATPR